MNSRLSFGVFAGLVLCCVVFLFVLTPRFAAPRASSLIAYVSDAPSGRCAGGYCGDQITLLDPDTGTYKTLDFENAMIATESLFWSPDRQFLGFMINGHLTIYSLEHKTVQEFPYIENSGYFGWIPQGLVRYERAEDLGTGAGRLYIVPFNGVDTPYNHLGVQLAPLTWYGRFSAMPDGSWGTLSSTDKDIYIVDMSNGETTNITNDEVIDDAPIWSPDGHQLAWVIKDAKPAVAIYDRETQLIRRIPIVYSPASLEWLSDDAVIVLVGSEEYRGLFQRLDLKTGETQNVMSYIPWGHDISPDRTQIVTIEIEDRDDEAVVPHVCRFDLRSLEKHCYQDVPQPGGSADPIWNGR